MPYPPSNLRQPSRPLPNRQDASHGDRPELKDPESFQENLALLVEHLHQEQITLQASGQALSASQQQRSQQLDRVLIHLRSALTLLTDGQPQPSISRSQPLRNGRYGGRNDELRVELRVDGDGSGMISADFFRIDPQNAETWVASARTNPGTSITAVEGTWPVVSEDQGQQLSAGQLTLKVKQQDPLTLSGTLRLDRPLAGIRGQVNQAFELVWQSDALRRLGLEIEQEVNTPQLPSFRLNDAEVITLPSALTKAGFETIDVGESSIIPTPPTAWGTAQLHALMLEHAQASLHQPAWELHLLMLGQSSRFGLLGIMFDTTANLPRQGSAVFAEEIRRFAADNYERKLLQTTLHELGHAFNLAHRFEREVGRADSTSCMNYDWRYRGGGHTQEFWQRFNFSFDLDELAFLRHAPLSAVIPGGRAFHSVAYWSEGQGGYSPYLPEVRIDDLELKLTGPMGGLIFDFLQPVFLQVELTNRTGQPLELPDWLLDPKAGALDVMIRRVQHQHAPDSAFLWVPVMQRCYELADQALTQIANGESIRRNLNLTFGAAGFAFAEPGEYIVQAVISLPNQSQQREYIVPSNPLRIRIGYPQSRDEEEDAMVLLRQDVGVYLALGGSHVLEAARDDLNAVRLRRQGRLRKIKDPVVANIVRCAGIDAGRAYLRRRDDTFVVEQGQREEAAKLLEKLDDQALQAFDPDTATQTKQLAQKHRQAVS